MFTVWRSAAGSIIFLPHYRTLQFNMLFSPTNTTFHTSRPNFHSLLHRWSERKSSSWKGFRCCFAEETMEEKNMMWKKGNGKYQTNYITNTYWSHPRLRLDNKVFNFLPHSTAKQLSGSNYVKLFIGKKNWGKRFIDSQKAEHDVSGETCNIWVVTQRVCVSVSW